MPWLKTKACECQCGCDACDEVLPEIMPDSASAEIGEYFQYDFYIWDCLSKSFVPAYPYRGPPVPEFYGFTYVTASLPGWATFDYLTGTIYGVPDVTEVVHFEVSGTNACGQGSFTELQISVGGAVECDFGAYFSTPNGQEGGQEGTFVHTYPTSTFVIGYNVSLSVFNVGQTYQITIKANGVAVYIGPATTTPMTGSAIYIPAGTTSIEIAITIIHAIADQNTEVEFVC